MTNEPQPTQPIDPTHLVREGPTDSVLSTLERVGTADYVLFVPRGTEPDEAKRQVVRILLGLATETDPDMYLAVHEASGQHPDRPSSSDELCNARRTPGTQRCDREPHHGLHRTDGDWWR